VAEKALAIGIYCSSVAEDDFKKRVLLSVNHSGDSNSTESITGNLLGAVCGFDTIPENWLSALELRGLIEETANFNPDNWYADEWSFIHSKLKTGEINQNEYDEAVEILDKKVEEMWKRLDGTYQINNGN